MLVSPNNWISSYYKLERAYSHTSHRDLKSFWWFITTLKQGVYPHFLTLYHSNLYLLFKWFPNLWYENHLKSLLKDKRLDTTLGVSDSVCLGWDLRFTFLTSSQITPKCFWSADHFVNECRIHLFSLLTSFPSMYLLTPNWIYASNPPFDGSNMHELQLPRFS